MDYQMLSQFRNLPIALILHFPVIKIKNKANKFHKIPNRSPFLTYRTPRIFVWYFEHIHGFNHTLHCHENILIDKLYKATLVLIRIAGPVDDSHLFNKGTLARLSGTWSEKRQKYELAQK